MRTKHRNSWTEQLAKMKVEQMQAELEADAAKLAEVEEAVELARSAAPHPARQLVKVNGEELSVLALQSFWIEDWRKGRIEKGLPAYDRWGPGMYMSPRFAGDGRQMTKCQGYFVPVSSLIQNYVRRQRLAKIEKQQDSAAAALGITEELEEELGVLFDVLEDRIESGEAPGLALSELTPDVEQTMRQALEQAWLEGRGLRPEDELDERETGNTALALASAMVLFGAFALELAQEVGMFGDWPSQRDLLERRRSRWVSYGGEAWAVYNQGLTYGADPNSVWVWEGTLDEKSCETCRQEVAAGPRPLSQISVLPGRDTECMTRCRHVLVQVK